MSDRVDATDHAFWGDIDDDVALERYRTLVGMVDDGVYQLDGEGTFVAVDETTAETMGYAREELVGEPIASLVDDAAADRIECALTAQLEGDDEPCSLEVTIRAADGTQVPCTLRLTAAIADEEWTGALGTVRKRRAPLESAAISTESIANVLDEADVGVFVLDAEFDIRWVDESIQTYLGLEREAVLGRDKRTLIETGLADRFADPDSFADAVLATYEDNTYAERFECRVTADEATGREERWLEHRSKPIRSGQFAGGRVELYYDITDRKRSEGALEESETQFHSLVDAVEEYAIFQLDPTGRIVSWNEGARQIKGYEREEILGKHISTFYTADDRAADVPETILERATATGSVEDEGWRVRNDGSRFWANVTLTAVMDADGTHRGFLKVTRDMTDRREREQQLQRERNLIDRILEASPVGMIVFDTDETVTRVNDRYRELFGASTDDLETSPFASERLFDDAGESVTHATHPYTAALRTGEPVFDRVLRIEPASRADERQWIVVNAVPLLDDDGTVDRVVATAEDITDLKERERELESELESILSRITDAFYALDDDWTVTYANDRARELIDFEGDELLGRSIWEVFEWGAESTLRTEYERAMAVQEPTSFELYSEPPEAWLEIHAYPSETGLSVYFRDISERKRRERALRGERNLVERIIDTSPVGIVTLNETGRLERVNSRAEAILGYDEHELSDLIRDLDRLDPIRPDRASVSTAEVLIDRLFRDGETIHNLELGIRRPDGQRIWVSVSATPLVDDGEITGAVITFADITDRKAYQRQLEASNERLEQFAYAASHDLQEPLRMVSSYLQLIEKRYADDLDADGREFIEYAVDGAERMREMIDGLLQYSRVETEGDPFEPVDLEGVIGDVLDDLQLRIEETDAEITVGELPTVRGDEDQLRQVFQNLFSNAIEYSGDGSPTIAVAAERSGSYWRIDVADDGVGIEPAETDRIFEVFQRLHSRDEHSGTGIGLALCQRIVERHGGEIWVDSEPGEGSTFSVTLPAVPESALEGEH
ncbi:PAS domain-containing sensor histidine kinase [Natronorubrum sulfidifaciens]|uniref:histidine kinase n=1 Tax=Natronorubrum sulfidifaciens JCM 14089 TaxID=1230460 RepID=L9VZP7_9EURY|nr:PAS domain S-box protein [Natronorubrum sulfidifaciens]ELY42547.1 multi-sensor signal transduction histidine kinase [Natronorubrum sulfidifaciens JCM 14089]